jgi:hypothetical protein
MNINSANEIKRQQKKQAGRELRHRTREEFSHVRYLPSWAKKMVSPGLCDIAEDAVAQPTELAFRVVVGLGLNEHDHKARHQRLATLRLQRQGLLKLNRSTIRGKQEGGGLIFCSNLCFASSRPPRSALFCARV